MVADIAAQLDVGARASNKGTIVLRGGLDRSSLHLSVINLDDDADRGLWLNDRLYDLQGSGIIYTLTVAAAQELADTLSDRGHNVAVYTGRTDAGDRVALEADLLANRVKALVATSALGMGFDKPDLGFVIHVGSPASPIAYYQQIGRAGRAMARADVILLPGPEDQEIGTTSGPSHSREKRWSGSCSTLSTRRSHTRSRPWRRRPNFTVVGRRWSCAFWK